MSVLSIGLARTCRVSSGLKHANHAMESLSNDVLGDILQKIDTVYPRST